MENEKTTLESVCHPSLWTVVDNVHTKTMCFYIITTISGSESTKEQTCTMDRTVRTPCGRTCGRIKITPYTLCGRIKTPRLARRLLVQPAAGEREGTSKETIERLSPGQHATRNLLGAD